MPDSSTDPRETLLTVPKTGRAAIYHENKGRITIEEDAPVIQPAQLGQGQVLVRILFSGCCHTDLHAWKGDWPLPQKLPLCGGHEGAGVVAALGPGAEEYVKIGDRVGIKWIADACGACPSCLQGDEQYCSLMRLSGYTVHGTFAQYVVSWARYVTRIPEGIPLADAASILCAGVTVFKGLKNAKLGPGQTVIVLGSGGGLGHLCCQYAAAAGYLVIGIDTGEEKRQVSLECGAEYFIDFRTAGDTLTAQIRAATPGKLGAHAAIVAAASGAAYEQALSYLRPGGTLVALGLPAGTEMKVPVFAIVSHQLKIQGSYVGNRQDAVEALDIAAWGKVKVKYQLRGLSELAAVFDEMEKGQLVGRVVFNVDK
ncbi:hypothetical protein V8E36_001783 [Tilletia maclaganii]